MAKVSELLGSRDAETTANGFPLLICGTGSLRTSTRTTRR